MGCAPAVGRKVADAAWRKRDAERGFASRLADNQVQEDIVAVSLLRRSEPGSMGQERKEEHNENAPPARQRISSAPPIACPHTSLPVPYFQPTRAEE